MPIWLIVLLAIWLLVLVGAIVVCLRAPNGEQSAVDGGLEVRRLPQRS